MRTILLALTFVFVAPAASAYTVGVVYPYGYAVPHYSPAYPYGYAVPHYSPAYPPHYSPAYPPYYSPAYPPYWHFDRPRYWHYDHYPRRKKSWKNSSWGR